jgi:hypothetical protein
LQTRLNFLKEGLKEQEQRSAGGGVGIDTARLERSRTAVKALTDEIARLKKESGDISEKSVAEKIGLDADNAVRALLPFIEQLDKARKAQAEIAKAQATPGADQGLAQYNKQAADAAKVLELNLMAAADQQKRLNTTALELVQIYGTQNIGVAKTLDALNRQLPVAQAVGQMAKIEAEYKARVGQLSQSMDAFDARRIASAERAVKLAEIEAQHQETMVQLRGQLNVASQVTGIGQINAQYEATVASLTLQIGLVRAIEEAELQRKTAIAAVNAEADRTLYALRQEGELIRASDEDEKDRIRSRQTYDNLVRKGVDSERARAVASKQLRNAEEQREKQQREAAEKGIANIRTSTDAWKLYSDGVISWSVANDEARLAAGRMEAAQQSLNGSIYDTTAELNAQAAAWKANADAMVRFTGLFATVPQNSILQGTLGKNIWEVSPGQLSQFNPAGYTSTTSSMGGDEIKTDFDKYLKEEWDRRFNTAFTQSGGDIGKAVNSLLSQPNLFTGTGLGGSDLTQNKVSALSSAIDLLPKEQQITPYQEMLKQLQAGPLTLETAPIVKQLADKIAELTQSTDANTSATNAQTDVLSPFYSSDPRRTHLGFRAFAGGGIMSQYGELPIHHYQGGGMATSPQVAVFGEGSTPEAYVPIPSGRIPVEVKTAANSNQKQRPVNVTINVMGNADVGTVAALKTTAFQQAQAMRRVMS